ncbi:MAG: hypothetical protein COB13_009855 [OCS116 cluster bacterium]|nr:hypothetical protein [OCS116 cluster bacterium]
MYAITARSSSAYQLARVTNEVETQARKFAVPQPAPSKYNQQGNVAGAANVQASTPASNHAIATKAASQVTSVSKTGTDNHAMQQKFSRPQQKQISRFNLEMVNENPKNATSRNRIEHVRRSGNVTEANKPQTAGANKFMESPYMIVVVNQSLSSMEQAKENNNTSNAQPPDKSDEKAQGARQPVSKII